MAPDDAALSPEQSLLLRCLSQLLRSRLVGPVPARPPDGLNWPALATEATRHGVAPLVYRRHLEDRQASRG